MGASDTCPEPGGGLGPEDFADDRYAPVILAGDLASQVFERVTLNDTLGTALRKLAVRGAHYVPVVADDDP